MKTIVIFITLLWLTTFAFGLSCFECDPSVDSNTECLSTPTATRDSKPCADGHMCASKEDSSKNIVLRKCLDPASLPTGDAYVLNQCVDSSGSNICACDSGDNCNNQIPTKKPAATQPSGSQSGVTKTAPAVTKPAPAVTSKMKCINCDGYSETETKECLTKVDSKYAKPCPGAEPFCTTLFANQKTIIKRSCFQSGSATEEEKAKYTLDSCKVDEKNTTHCSCSTDECNDKGLGNLLLKKYPPVFRCYQCESDEDNDGGCQELKGTEVLFPCQAMVWYFNGTLPPYYCTLEVLGKQIRRNCETDLPPEKYAKLNGCHDYKGVKYCYCNTFACNNDTLVTGDVNNVAPFPIEILIATALLSFFIL